MVKAVSTFEVVTGDLQNASNEKNPRMQPIKNMIWALPACRSNDLLVVNAEERLSCSLVAKIRIWDKNLVEMRLADPTSAFGAKLSWTIGGGRPRCSRS